MKKVSRLRPNTCASRLLIRRRLLTCCYDVVESYTPRSRRMNPMHTCPSPDCQPIHVSDHFWIRCSWSPRSVLVFGLNETERNVMASNGERDGGWTSKGFGLDIGVSLQPLTEASGAFLQSVSCHDSFSETALEAGS